MIRRRSRSIAGLPVNKAKCKTCPFGEGGVVEIRVQVERRVLTQGSQLCHETDNTTLCRGGRDFQLQSLHRMGILPAATDEAWAAMAERTKT